MSQKCEVCQREVQGDYGVTEGELEDGAWVAFVYEKSRRNWMQCDSCGKVVCHDCCEYPKSGYCDSCIEKYGYSDYLEESEVISN